MLLKNAICSPAAAARLLMQNGFVMVAHVDRTLTYKVSGTNLPFIPGGWEFSYPNVEIAFWFYVRSMKLLF